MPLARSSPEVGAMKSPGHRDKPDHKVEETHLHEPIKVKVNGELIAEANDVIKVDEDGNPPRYYFLRSDVKMEKLAPTETTTKCPFKGTAHYFSVDAGGRSLKDAVWTYEEPFDEHADLKDRVAFYDDKIPEIAIERTRH
jgi:uncharacterized protein (DUF427 family)